MNSLFARNGSRLALIVITAMTAMTTATMSASAWSAPSMEKLDTAAQALTAVIDGKKDAPNCGISAQEAKTLILPLHARIDQKTDELIAQGKGKIPASTLARWKRDCAQGCHCDRYSMVLEKAGQEPLPEKKQNKTRCLKQAKSFCKSPLLKELRAEAKDYRTN